MTAIELKAAEVWLRLNRGTLAPKTGLGMIVAIAADVRPALNAILMSAMIATAEARPTAKEQSGGSLPDIVAGGIAGHLIREEYDRAAATLAELKQWIHHVDATAHPYPLASQWLDWCAEMERAITLCRDLSAEARPPGAAS